MGEAELDGISLQKGLSVPVPPQRHGTSPTPLPQAEIAQQPSGHTAQPICFSAKGAGTMPALWGEEGCVGFQGVWAQLMDGEQKHRDVFWGRYVTNMVSFR